MKTFQFMGKPAKNYLFSGDPYQFVNVYVNGKSGVLYLHRAIALVHVEGYFDGAWVDHIDRNPYNNNPKNLRWVTPAENNKNKHVDKRRLQKRIFKLEEKLKALKTKLTELE